MNVRDDRSVQRMGYPDAQPDEHGYSSNWPAWLADAACRKVSGRCPALSDQKSRRRLLPGHHGDNVAPGPAIHLVVQGDSAIPRDTSELPAAEIPPLQRQRPGGRRTRLRDAIQVAR